MRRIIAKYMRMVDVRNNVIFKNVQNCSKMSLYGKTQRVKKNDYSIEGVSRMKLLYRLSHCGP